MSVRVPTLLGTRGSSQCVAIRQEMLTISSQTHVPPPGGCAVCVVPLTFSGITKVPDITPDVIYIFHKSTGSWNLEL